MGSTARFLLRLRQLLDNPEKYGDNVKWVHNGRAIQITNEKEFANTVLPQVFNYSNFNSFVRKLNVYGFRKTQRKLHERIYYHPQFIRDDPNLASAIRRSKRRDKEILTSALPISRGETLMETREPAIPRLPSLQEVLKNIRHSTF